MKILSRIFRRKNKAKTIIGTVEDLAHKLDAIGSYIKNLDEQLLGYINHDLREKILADKKHQDPKRLLRYGHKVFSQHDEDGILNEIFKRIGTTNKKFFEFGVGDGLENNSLYLLYKGWSGVWIEGDKNSYEKIVKNADIFISDLKTLKVINDFVSTKNINQIIEENDLHELDLFHIDIDGNDYHVVKAISKISARVVMVEYNALFPADFAWTIKNDPNHRWVASTHYGCSLLAWDQLMNDLGYKLVGCNITGTNAFYVRNDLVGDKFLAPFTTENHYEPRRYYLSVSYQHPNNFRPEVKSFETL